MTLESLKSLIESTKIPTWYGIVPDDQELPYIKLYQTNTDNFKADNKVYKKVRAIEIELYTERKNTVLEDAIESVLNDNSIPWESDEQYDDSETFFMQVYSIQLED